MLGCERMADVSADPVVQSNAQNTVDFIYVTTAVCLHQWCLPLSLSFCRRQTIKSCYLPGATCRRPACRHASCDQKPLTLAEPLSPLGNAIFTAGTFFCSSQCPLDRYWHSFPGQCSVLVVVGATVRSLCQIWLLAIGAEYKLAHSLKVSKLCLDVHFKIYSVTVAVAQV